MEITIQGIALEDLSLKDRMVYDGLDKQTYGRTLVEAVVQKLQTQAQDTNQGGTETGLYHAHRDYCGVGLYYIQGAFVLGEVNDGMGPYPILARFPNKEVFITWLSSQSDQSMALITHPSYPASKFNNQTISRDRLEWYLHKAYSPAWNAYCLYLRER